MRDRIEALGGIARMSALLATGLDRDLIELATEYRRVIRVRQGVYAVPGLDPDVIAAARVGGRLACVSAIARHEGSAPPRVLHVAVRKNASRLRLPSDREVVIHWMRRAGRGGPQSVTIDEARRQAARCRNREG